MGFCYLCSLSVTALSILVQGREACVDIPVSQIFCLNFHDGIKITSEFLFFLRVPALLLGNMFFKSFDSLIPALCINSCLSSPERFINFGCL